MIGIGITTHNRPEVLKFTLSQFEKHDPDEELVYLVVDDNSKKKAAQQNEKNAEMLGAYILNDRQRGVAGSKNECIRFFMEDPEFEHIFLFDDDCFPVKDGWWESWIKSGEHHLSLASDINQKRLKEKENVVAWNGCLGCCMLFTRSCLEKVGGFDTRFKTYGYEHVELTQRIHKAGISSDLYQCVLDNGVWSFDLQGSHPEFKWKGKSCLQRETKDKAILENSKIFNEIKSDNSIFREI